MTNYDITNVFIKFYNLAFIKPQKNLDYNEKIM